MNSKISGKLILTALICFLVFIFIITEILLPGFLVQIDLSINSFIPSIHNPSLINISRVIDMLFDVIPIVFISLILSIFLWFRYSKKESAFFALTMIFNAAVIYLVKEVIQRARPLNSLLHIGDFAFPSGHSTTAVVFFGLLIYVVFLNNKSRIIKIISVLAGIFMMFLIGFSRIYLNMHWFSDVFGGFVLGGFVLSICLLIKNFLENKKF